MEERMAEALTANQKNKIYTEMLVPMKNKISQILLYDTNAAAKFLTEYNEITTNDDITVSELMALISSLELSIQDYEKSEGKEKFLEEKAKILSKNIKELGENSIGISAANFEAVFLKFRENYDLEIVNHAYSDRDSLEQEFHELQADLIKRKIAETKGQVDLSSVIKEQDKPGLSIWVRNKANELKENSKYSEFATKINEMLLLREDAVMIPELWEWLNAAEKGRVIEKTNNVTNLEQDIKALTVPKEEKKLGFLGSIRKSMSSKPIFPLDKTDFKKITLEWLGTQVTKEMQIEEEKRRLQNEGLVAEEMYLPSGEYVAFQKIQRLVDSYGQKEREEILFGENGTNMHINVSQSIPSYLRDWSYDRRDTHTEIKLSVGNKEETKQGQYKLADVLEYTEWLDTMCGSNFKQEVLKEIKTMYFDGGKIKDRIIERSLSNLYELAEEFEKKKIDVWRKEEAKRDKFYKDHPLKDKEKIRTTQKQIIIPEEVRKENDSHQEIEQDDSEERV